MFDNGSSFNINKLYWLKKKRQIVVRTFDWRDAPITLVDGADIFQGFAEFCTTQFFFIADAPLL